MRRSNLNPRQAEALSAFRVLDRAKAAAKARPGDAEAMRALERAKARVDRLPRFAVAGRAS